MPNPSALHNKFFLHEGHSMSNQRKTNMTPPEFLQIWCGEGVYGLTQPHQILSETIKYSWICGHLNVAILTIFLPS